MQSPVKIWRNQKHIASLLGQEGKVVSWTYVRVPPSGFSSVAPYAVVLVELDAGGRVTAQLADASGEDVSIGMRVRVVVRRSAESSVDGIIPYGIKVKLL